MKDKMNMLPVIEKMNDHVMKMMKKLDASRRMRSLKKVTP